VRRESADVLRLHEGVDDAPELGEVEACSGTSSRVRKRSMV
jgi:hypothetical protein